MNKKEKDENATTKTHNVIDILEPLLERNEYQSPYLNAKIN